MSDSENREQTKRPDWGNESMNDFTTTQRPSFEEMQRTMRQQGDLDTTIRLREVDRMKADGDFSREDQKANREMADRSYKAAVDSLEEAGYGWNDRRKLMKEYREGRDQAIDRWRSRQAEVVQEEPVQYAESDLGELSAPTVGSDQPNGRIERA